MTYKFTNSAQNVLEIAKEIAIELGHNYTFFGITSGLCLMTISQFAGDM